MQNPRPTYSLDKVKLLVAKEQFVLSKRVIGWLMNHGFAPARTVKNIILELSESDYYKTDKLDVAPKINADIYRTSYEDEEWYIKLFLEDGTICVNIWSCCWDGFLH